MSESQHYRQTAVRHREHWVPPKNSEPSEAYAARARLIGQTQESKHCAVARTPGRICVWCASYVQVKHLRHEEAAKQ